jgi:sialic acid synthase SpsE
MRLVLDVGSGKSLPDRRTIARLVDAIKAVDTRKHEIVLKAQLFKSAPPNIPLPHANFEYLYEYAKGRGYKVTSSIFDLESLDYLQAFDVPFIKIADRPELDWLADEIRRKFTIYKSTHDMIPKWCNTVWLYCVPKYPAPIEDYELFGTVGRLSDHTIGWELYNKYKPEILEKHIVLERSPDNPDAGLFAIVPADLKEIM